MKSKIFINYRKDDSPWNSLALYQELIKHFGKENVFKDFNTILPGTDFVESIEDALESCDVLLVLISEHWADIKDKNGNLRINNPDDFVRLEIATALRRNIKVIPVLFDNAVLPPAEELPDDLKKLARRQFIEIDKTRFEDDTARLVETIKNILRPSVAGQNMPVSNDSKEEPIKNEAALKEATITKPPVANLSASGKSSGGKKTGVLIAVIAGIILLSYFLFNLISNKKDSATIAAPDRKDSAVTQADTVKNSAVNNTRDTVYTSQKGNSQNTANSGVTKEKAAGKTSNSIPPPKTASAAQTFADFNAAYDAAFTDAENNFINLKGETIPDRPMNTQTFKTNVSITDPGAEAANIFQRNNEWGFRFLLQGPDEKEESRFEDIDWWIIRTFNKNRMKHQKIPIQYGKVTNPLQSYEYKRLPYRVDFNRSTTGNVYHYEIIIYHKVN